jgi:hypothetical protein
MARAPASPNHRFRPQIETAIADGAVAADLVLRLTLRDVTQLSRDPEIALADISYAGGEMKFLGVRVEKGGVTESRLDRAAT